MKKEYTIDDIFGDSLNLKLDDSPVEKIEIEKQDESGKLVKVYEDGLEIISDELMKKVKRKQLSASMVSGFAQCPADWLMNSFLLPDMDHEEPIYFARGHIFHDTMETFFNLAKEERTPQSLSQIAMKVIKKDYKEYLEDKETMRWMQQALKGYIEAGFEYKNVDVAQIVKDPEKGPEIGTELFVKGKLGNTEREVVGFVDRVDQLPNGSLGIVDYKTGKKIQPFDPSKPIGDNNSFDYWRQQLAYTMLLEQEGHYIGGAKLEFPIAKGEVIVDVRNDYLRKQVEKDFERTDAALTKCIDENFFPFHGHFFCKWCGMLSPHKHRVSRFGKLNVSWADVNQYVRLLDS